MPFPIKICLADIFTRAWPGSSLVTLISESLFWDKRRRRAEMAFLIVQRMVFPNSITQGGWPYVLIFWINTLPFELKFHTWGTSIQVSSKGK